jgi:type II secretory pathway predicted ATPase ExeA
MYTSYFGFREKPFNVTPDPHVFYTNPGYQEAYANLLYGIRERKGFLVLTGEVGTGKTTILRRLMENLESTTPFVFFYNTTLSFEELLSFICEELGLPVHGDGLLERIKALNKFLIDQLEKGSTAVLIIDEAQNLSDEVFEDLRLLSNLETSTEKLLQIVLAGQPELEKKLDQSQLRQLKQRIFLHSRLDCLREEEVGAFIEYRLKAVGYERNDLFSRGAVRQIAFYSKGIPRLINIICDNALLITYGDSRKAVSADVIREAARDVRLGSKVRSPFRSRLLDGTLKIGSLDFHLANLWCESFLTKAVTPAAKHKNGSNLIAKVTPENSATEIPIQPFLNTLTRALTEAMGPMAPLVVRDQLATLGTFSATIPITSLEKLIESVSSEILNNLLRISFKRKMSEMFGALNSSSVTEVT